MTQLEKKEMEVLEYVGLPALPAPHDPKDADGPIWARAIALVRTLTNAESYAVVVNDAAPAPKVTKVFDTRGIAEFVTLYPYEFLRPDALPATKTLADARVFVMQNYGLSAEEVARTPKDVLKRLLLRYALRRQLTEAPKKDETTEPAKTDIPESDE